MKALSAVTLVGQHVRLGPATEAHAAALWETVTEDVFRYMPARVRDQSELRGLLTLTSGLAARGEGLSLLQVALPEAVVAGHTGLWNPAPEHDRVEIGMTWLAPRFRRTPANTEAKLLLLRHAFEELGAHRVEFKTDARNTASRTALRRLGACEEGTLRGHMRLGDGSRRDSVYYSILADEWPGVEARLESFLRPPRR